MNPDVLYMKENEPLVIPCRVTNPNVTTELVKVCADVFYLLSECSAETCSASRSLHALSAFAPSLTFCSLHINIAVPSFFHQVLHMHAIQCSVMSPCPDHSPHCSYLGNHCTVACVSVCLCPSADMCESVCGYVCECWRLSAD